MSSISIQLIRLLVISVFFLSPFFPKTIFAVTTASDCEFTPTPAKPDQNTGDITIKVTSKQLPHDYYRLMYKEQKQTSVAYNRFTPELGSSGAEFVVGSGVSFIIKKPNTGWPINGYNFWLIQQDLTLPEGKPDSVSTCPGALEIKVASAQSSCIARVSTKPIEPNTTIELTLRGINPGEYKIYINGVDRYTNTFKSSDGKPLDTVVELLPLATGTYVVEVKNTCPITGCSGELPRDQCNPETFVVGDFGSKGGGRIETNSTTESVTGCTQPEIDNGTCTSAKGRDLPNCTGNYNASNPGISTAIGCIHTKPAEFVKDVLKFIIALSGGIAFLLMLIGAFQMLTSAGNPEHLNAGRERLTSAIIGLLFVIFAILLMQIIGIGILDLPGFKP